MPLQAFVRDPDGYYIEFCSCESLENYLKDKMATHSTISSQNDWNLQLTSGMMKVNEKFRTFSISICDNDEIIILFPGWDAAQKEVSRSKS